MKSRVDGDINIRHLKTDYPAGEDKIRQLEKGGTKMVPCRIESEDDHYVFTYDSGGLMTYDAAMDFPIIQKYEILLKAAELSELTGSYSFTIDPGNLLIDESLSPKIIERSFPDHISDFISEYKALIGTTIDPSHSFEDYLKGGIDLFEQSSLLAEISKAQTLPEITEILSEAAQNERSYNDKTYEVVKKKEYKRLKILLPVFAVLLTAALGLLGYEHFAVGKVDKSTIKATELYFAGDYKSVGKELSWANPEELSDASRYMAAVSAINSSGLSAEQKSVILKESERNRTNKDYLNYWVCIGRQDYVEADQYAQKIMDDEHRAFALALRRSQIEKDPGISGSEKTEQIKELDEEIKALLESINESKYGLTDSEAEAAAEPSTEPRDTEGAEDNTDTAKEEGPKLLN